MDLTPATVMETPETLHARGLAEPFDVAGRSGWKLTPGTAQDVADLLHWAAEGNRQVALCEQDATLQPTAMRLDLSNLTSIRQHSPANFTVQAETGLTFGGLDKALKAYGQEWALTYPKDMRLIDIVAGDVPALETGLRGYPRDFVLKTEIATPDGGLTVSGADVVKNVTGYDLHKVYTGARHAFGVVTAVTLKLSARPEARECWCYTLYEAETAFELAEKMLAGPLPLRVCELSLEDAGGHAVSGSSQNAIWKLTVVIAGEENRLRKAAGYISAFEQEEARPVGGLRVKMVGEARARTVLHDLQVFPENATVIEAALPLGRWRAFATWCLEAGLANAVKIPRQEMAEPMESSDSEGDWPRFRTGRLQIRPAAGLVYISLPELPEPEKIATIAAEAERLEGFIQVLQLPDPARWPDFCEFNLPRKPATRCLLQALKTRYDPKGTLFVPSLPLLSL